VELQARLEVPAAVVGGDDTVTESPSARADVRQALAGLGYAPDEIRDALARLPDDGALEDLLRDALRLLAAART
jgi:Holliday junction resolvasome RuvABC DNA-binding subunit